MLTIGNIKIMKYRKTAEVEAFKLGINDIPDPQKWPIWLWKAVDEGTVNFSNFSIKTMEGPMQFKQGDWIIRGAEGEVYACDDEVFHGSYDPVSIGKVHFSKGWIGFDSPYGKAFIRVGSIIAIESDGPNVDILTEDQNYSALSVTVPQVLKAIEKANEARKPWWKVW